jgi:predicted amidophosphoribosyltransferase
MDRQAGGMRIVGELVELVLPVSCVCCQRPRALWCAGCRPVSQPELAALAHAPPTYAAGSYDAELRTALLSYKERGHRALLGPLAGYLADAVDVAVRALVPDGCGPVLVPVPSTRVAARQRGGDHVRRLARVVAREHALRVVPAVHLTGPVADSAGLSPAQRAANLTGRMRATPAPTGLAALLVDDLVTTGTTLTEAARALSEAGWQTAGAAVIGATRLRRAGAC